MDYKRLRVYVIDWKKLGGGDKFSSARDCVDVMYDEFRLNACVRGGKISVRTNSDREVDKIKRFMRKYGADSAYIDSVIGSVNPRVRRKTDESVMAGTKNKMPARMAKYTLNEKFDHRSDGVLAVSAAELVRMIPALLRNGKKVVAFVFDGLVDDVRKVLAKNIPSLQGKVGVTTFDKLVDACTREGLSGTVSEITPDIYVNDPVRNVFITTFHDDGVNYVKFSPDFGRKCACFVVGADMTDGVQVTRRPDSVSHRDPIGNWYKDRIKWNDGVPVDDQGVQESARTMSGVRRRKINESKLNMRSNRLNESRGRRNADANLAGRRFVDMLVNETGYNASNQPNPEEYCNMLLNVKNFVINESNGYDGKKFVDLASYLTHKKLDMSGVTKKPGYSAVVGDKMFNTPSLDESVRYFGRALRLHEAVDVNSGNRNNRDKMFNTPSLDEVWTRDGRWHARSVDVNGDDRDDRLNKYFPDGIRFADMLLTQTGYNDHNQPNPEEYCDMLLNLKNFVINKSNGYDGQRFVDLASYLTHDKLHMFRIRTKPGYSEVVGPKMFNTPSLDVSVRYFSLYFDRDFNLIPLGGAVNNKKYTVTMTTNPKTKQFSDSSYAVSEAARQTAPKSDFGAKSVDGVKLKEYKLSDLVDLLADRKARLADQKKYLRSEKDERKAARIQKLVDKLQNEIDMIKNEISFRKKNKMNESVRSRFGRYRRVFESDGDDDKSGDGFEDMFKDIENDDPDAGKKDDDSDKKSDDGDDNDEVPMTAVLVMVAKEDVDKAKRQMIEAGVEEDDIDVVDNDDDDEDVEIKVDANSIMALKDWLDTKGVDLEEKLGGEIVPPDSDGDDDGKGSDDKEPDFDDMDFDDIFGKDDKDGKKDDK